MFGGVGGSVLMGLKFDDLRGKLVWLSHSKALVMIDKHESRRLPEQRDLGLRLVNHNHHRTHDLSQHQ